jgi:hypothetical protein
MDYEVKTNSYPPTPDDELDRHYIIVQDHGVQYEQQFHQNRPRGTGFSMSQYPGFDPHTAGFLDGIAYGAMAQDGVL